MKIHNEDSDTGYFIESGVQNLEHLHILYNDLLILPEKFNRNFKKLTKFKNLFPTCMIKKDILSSNKIFKTSIKSWIGFEKCA